MLLLASAQGKRRGSGDVAPMRHGLLVLGLFSLVACDVELGKASAERAWDSEGRGLRLVAQGVANYGVAIDGAGAPDAIGCFWPTLAKKHPSSSGYSRMTVRRWS